MCTPKDVDIFEMLGSDPFDSGQNLLGSYELAEMNTTIDTEGLVYCWARVALLTTSSLDNIRKARDCIKDVIAYMLRPNVKKEKPLVAELQALQRVFKLEKPQLALYLMVNTYRSKRAYNGNVYTSFWGPFFGYSREQKLNVANRLLNLLLGFDDKPLTDREIDILEQGGFGKVIKVWEEQHNQAIPGKQI